jgi:hypothetical protein
MYHTPKFITRTIHRETQLGIPGRERDPEATSDMD